MFGQGDIATGGRMTPSANLFFAKRTLIVWELNTEGLGSLWLNASAKSMANQPKAN
jgi:hypothetical protein